MLDPSHSMHLRSVSLSFISACIISNFDSNLLYCILCRVNSAASSCNSTPHTFLRGDRPHHKRGIVPHPVPKSAQSWPFPGMEKWARRMVSVLKRWYLLTNTRMEGPNGSQFSPSSFWQWRFSICISTTLLLLLSYQFKDKKRRRRVTAPPSSMHWLIPEQERPRGRFLHKRRTRCTDLHRLHTGHRPQK